MMKLAILGIRGIPAEHGGFETFAEHFSLFLKEKRWEVTVYCQKDGDGPIYEDDWHGVHRIHIPVLRKGAKGTIIFDWISTLHAAKKNIPVLTLGYNTAIFCFLYRLKNLKNIINMDGIEWRRNKWTRLERNWLHINEKLGTWFGNHLIADHPEIKNHLSRLVSPDKITVIPYCGALLKSADSKQLDQYNLKPGGYTVLIARPEPENLILEIIRAYSTQKRGIPLVVLGDYNPHSNGYQKAVLTAAKDEIIFIGAIYHQPMVQALRFYARFYIHGHTVGGTNPSLVEALGAGSAVLAHDNRFNRWVAGKGAHYFSSEAECAKKISLLVGNNTLIKTMKTDSLEQYINNFTANKIHTDYELLLKRHGF